MWRKTVRDYFTFTRRERKGILVLSILILILIFLPYLYPLFLTAEKQDMGYEKSLAMLEMALDSGKELSNYSSTSKQDIPKGELFYFDPNTATPQQWKRLGLRAGVIQTIGNYIEKGGRFYQAEDLRKIYGLHSSMANRLIPYIRIAQVETAELQKEKFEEYKPTFVSRPQPPKAIEPVDINTNDTVAFLALPGIGPGYTARIFKWRHQLGGFRSIDQIGEMYGMPDSLMDQIRPYLFISQPRLVTINVNTADFGQLNRHPYISRSVAKAIIAYREQHGPFKELSDLKNIMIIKEKLYQKIEPYLSVE